MLLATRLSMVDAKLRPDYRKPRLVVVLEDEDGGWRDGRGDVVDLGSVGKRVRVIRLAMRPDGPQ